MHHIEEDEGRSEGTASMYLANPALILHIMHVYSQASI